MIIIPIGGMPAPAEFDRPFIIVCMCCVVCVFVVAVVLMCFSDVVDVLWLNCCYFTGLAL